MQVTGTIEKIGETILVSDKFQKREVVIKHGDNPEYLELNSFEFTQDKCDILDKYKAGQQVDLEFNLKGRAYEDKKTNTTKYFNTLQAWKINEVGSTANTSNKRQSAYAENDSLPF